MGTIFILFSSVSALFWRESSENGSAEVTDMAIRLNVVISENEGKENRETGRLVLLDG